MRFISKYLHYPLSAKLPIVVSCGGAIKNERVYQMRYTLSTDMIDYQCFTNFVLVLLLLLYILIIYTPAGKFSTLMLLP